jgi:sirohydrochlorin ferrochelatase
MNEWGIMVCGHGSRDGQAVEEFQAVAQGLRERMPEHETEWGFLEFATPIIRDGLDALRTKGFRKVLAVPGMLFAAGHAKNDIPSVLNDYAARHDGFGTRDNEIRLAAKESRHLNNLSHFSHGGGLLRRMVIGDDRDAERFLDV